MAAPLTGADRKRYNACVSKKILDLSNTQMVSCDGNFKKKFNTESGVNIEVKLPAPNHVNYNRLVLL